MWYCEVLGTVILGRLADHVKRPEVIKIVGRSSYDMSIRAQPLSDWALTACIRKRNHTGPVEWAVPNQ